MARPPASAACGLVAPVVSVSPPLMSPQLNGRSRRASATTCARMPTIDGTCGSRPNPNAPTARVCAGAGGYPV